MKLSPKVWVPAMAAIFGTIAGSTLTSISTRQAAEQQLQQTLKLRRMEATERQFIAVGQAASIYSGSVQDLLGSIAAGVKPEAMRRLENLGRVSSRLLIEAPKPLGEATLEVNIAAAGSVRAIDGEALLEAYGKWLNVMYQSVDSLRAAALPNTSHDRPQLQERPHTSWEWGVVEAVATSVLAIVAGMCQGL